MLQHRGQDAAGIVTISDNRFNLLKNVGTVADVFHQENVIGLLGSVGIGHVRYPTAGGSCSAEAQPLFTSAPFGIALAHNGNLTNTDELMRRYDNNVPSSSLAIVVPSPLLYLIVPSLPYRNPMICSKPLISLLLAWNKNIVISTPIQTRNCC